MSLPSLRSSVSEKALERLGRLVRGYRIDRLLGVGGMASVYAATHRDGGRAAIKFMLERFVDDPAVCALFEREVVVANRVGHPGAVPVLDHGVDEYGCAFLIMPLLEGETLRARWERRSKRLPLAEVGVLMADVLEVLAAAHDKGIVHRDIKPENIFVTTTGDVRVLDFGIARRTDGDGTATITAQVIGTPAFMPPEQALGDGDAIGTHSDCWAAGATIFALTSGELVHPVGGARAQLAAASAGPARSLAAADPSLPAAIVGFVDKALAFAAQDRWRTAGDMRTALLAAFEEALGEPVPAIAAQVRATLVAELSRDTEETRAKSGLGERAHDEASGRRFRRESMRVAQEIEVRVYFANTMSNVEMLPNEIYRILAKHGFGRFDERGWFVPDTRDWWPTGLYVAMLHEIDEVFGAVKTTEVSAAMAKHAHLDQGPPDIHAALRAFDAWYHLDHRKGEESMFDMATGRMLDGIGHISYEQAAPRCIRMRYDGPYPCNVDRGVLLGFARRYEPLALVEHMAGPCRMSGDACCIYEVTW